MKQFLFYLLFLSSITFAGEFDIISRKHLYVPPKLGKLRLALKDNEFYILKDDTEIPVRYENTNHLLRHITESGSLKQFLNEGCIFVSQDNGDYILTAKGCIKSGGKIIAALVGATTVAVAPAATTAATVAGPDPVLENAAR